MDPAVLRAVNDCSCLSHLSDEDQRWLAGVGECRSLAPGDVVIHAGATASHFVLTRSGSIRVAAEDDLDDTIEAGELLGFDVALEAGVHPSTATATEPTEIVLFPAAPLLDRLDGRFEMMAALLAGASVRLRMTVNEITDLKLKSTTRRLATFLHGLAASRRGKGLGKTGGGPDGAGRRVVLPCEKHMLAERLGMQPESLSRAFARLRSMGVETDRGDAVIIADVEALGLYCRAGDDG